MRAVAAKAPLQSRDRWRLRLIATAAALLLVAVIYFIQRLPAAVTLDENDEALTATSTRTLALYNLRAAPVMQYDGAQGAGLRLSISTGRLSDATRANLTALGLQVPNVKGGHIQWQGRPPPNGRISVRIRNERSSPEAGMMLQATGSGNISELNIRAVQTVLTAEIAIAVQDDSEAPVAELKFADVNLDDPALAFAPLQFEIQPGEAANLTFDSEDALSNSTFRLGELLETGGTATALSLGRAEVGRLGGTVSDPRLRSVIRGVCAASPGKLLFTRLAPTPADCRLGKAANDDNLFASEVSIEPRKVALALEGSGFVLTDNRAKPAAFWSSLMANPLVAALMAGLVYAVARPLWRLWTGRDM